MGTHIKLDKTKCHNPLTGLTKKQIRSKILFELKTQKEEEQNRKSRIIKAKLFRTSLFKKAKKVMFYLSFGGEVGTYEMIKEAQDLGKIVTVPACSRDRVIRPCLYKNNIPLARGPYGVDEPAIKRWVDIRDLDLVIVPAVAFDKQGRRLGRGKGCYDRFLKRLYPYKTASIGLAFDFQISPLIPTTKHDVSVKRVIFA